MQSFVPEELSPLELYGALANAIIPRPIALVSTLSAAGIPNLAPFSYFNMGGIEPPSLVFCPGRKRSGAPKDSLQNIEETGEFVVNLVHREIVGAMNQTAAELPAETNEWELAGLTMLTSTRVAPARVAESHAHFECKLFQVLRHGPGSVYVVGEIVAIHLEPGALPVARLGGSAYVDLAESPTFEIERPR